MDNDYFSIDAILAENQLFFEYRQTFKGRLVDVIDQAQHFAALGPVEGGGGGGIDSAPQMFREGLDTTERERTYQEHVPNKRYSSLSLVFVLAQESARRMKKWYEESSGGTKRVS
ncbi:hypothetical protein HHX47_DHR5000098 [Lentinula edodes]|nr:hypothetical protein HHX47_DHR5000098 [Lentinula edodes]